MVSPLKIAAKVEIDSSQAVQGGKAASVAVDGIGTAADQTAAKLRAVDQAAAGLGALRPNSAPLTAEGKALDDLRAKYNPLYATMRNYRAEITAIKAAHAAGALGVNEMTAAITRERQAVIATAEAYRRRNNDSRPPRPNNNNNPLSDGAQKANTANIAAQFQDIAVTAQYGDPLQVALQQGTQLSSILGPLGVGGSIKALQAGLMSLVSPVSLITIGLIAGGVAAYQYFTSASADVKKLDDVLETHEKTIKRLESAYGGVITSARNYARENRVILEAASRKAMADLLGASKVENSGFLDAVELSSFVTGGAGLVGLETKFEPFRAEILKLREQVKAGKPEFDAFLASVQKTAATDPKYLKSADELALLVEKAKSAKDAIDELRRAELARAAGQRGFLINSQADNDYGDYVDQQNKALRDQVKRYEASIANMNARSPAERAAAARLNSGLEDDGNGGEAQKQRVNYAGLLAQAEAEKALSDAQRERRQSLEASIEQQQLELSLFGKTIAEQERLRMQYQLISELKADAERNGIAVDHAEISRIKERSAAYGQLAEQLAALKALQDADREIQKLQAQLSLAGETESVRARILRQMETENRIRDLGLAQGSAEAEQLRQKSALAGELTDQIKKQEAAWEKVRSTGENTIDSIVDAASKGDFKSLLGDVAKDWSKTLLEMGVTNPLKNATLGTNKPTIDDAGGLGGIITKLFGGGAADTVGAMTVTAGTVMVNGGVAAGLGGATGPLFGSNDNNATSAAPIGAVTRMALPAVGQTKTGIPLSEIQAAGGLTAKVSSAYAPRFQGLLDDLKAAGYKVSSLGEGGYSYRNVAGTNNLSEHSFGEALDINPRQNPWSNNFQTDLPANVNDLAKKNGLTWGGTWNKPDTMHFQVDKSASAASLALEKMAGASGEATKGLGSLGGGLGSLGDALSKFPAAPAAGGGGGGFGGWLSSLFRGPFVPNGAQATFAANGGIGLYANGGISDRPAIFGEGPMVEAAVPLPNGRSIPVDMRMTQAMPRMAPYANTNTQPAAPAMGPPVIHNYSTASIEHEEKTDERGGRHSEFTIADTIGSGLSKRGGGAERTMARVFGVKRNRIAR
ncbi:M15 family metallopeptidase [Rhizobium herbae]